MKRLAILLLVLLVGCHKRPPATTEAPPAEIPPRYTEPADSSEGHETPAEEAGEDSTAEARELAPVFFAFDAYALDAGAMEVLRLDAKRLREEPAVRIRIGGYCDERGTIEYNQSLGESRALAERDYLVNSGIAAARLDVISYGKELPFDPGHDESAWAKNRRVELVVKR
jgi:peptidoglycan-associated lipoprotein